MRKLSIVFGMIALAMVASADVRNIRPPTTGEGKLGTTSYKWGEIHAEDGYYSNLILGGLNITNKFLSPYDGSAGEVFYANGLGGGVWGAASSPTNGISQSVAESLFASIEQGETADAALPRDGSAPMQGDLDFDGYDIVDASNVDADSLSTAKSRSKSWTMNFNRTWPNNTFLGANTNAANDTIYLVYSNSVSATYLANHDCAHAYTNGWNEYLTDMTYGVTTNDNQFGITAIAGSKYVAFHWDGDPLPVGAPVLRFGKSIVSARENYQPFAYKATFVSHESSVVHFGTADAAVVGNLVPLSAQSQYLSSSGTTYTSFKILYYNSTGDNRLCVFSNRSFLDMSAAISVTVTTAGSLANVYFGD